MIANTGSDGKFQFNNLKKDTYNLQVSYLGYENQQKQVDLTSSKSLDIILKHAHILVEEVLVSASRAGENSPIAHTTLSKETIRNENLGQDIPYLLSSTPSFVCYFGCRNRDRIYQFQDQRHRSESYKRDHEWDTGFRCRVSQHLFC